MTKDLTKPRVARLEVENFKAFRRFSVRFGEDSIIVGPNNAGKSTLVAALRATARMLRHGRRRRADGHYGNGDFEGPGYGLGGIQLDLVTDNLRHEFADDVATTIRVTFDNGGKLTAVWPPGESDSPYFYLESKGGRRLRTPVEVRDSLPTLEIIPMLAPVEQEEGVRNEEYVLSQFDTRRASLHFRNQLAMLASQGPDRYSEFLALVARWLPEVTLERPIGDWTGDGYRYSLFYMEHTASRVPKELFWAGDGIQVWLQLLLHVFYYDEASVVILDEPDLYLHPDLQRRLVRLLEEMPAQTITATHSAELLGEAAPQSVVWVDKTRTSAVAAPKPEVLAELSAAIGTGFNLGLARALRSKVALFVEGDDMKILRLIATKIQAERVSKEFGITVISLKGFTNWEHLEPFAWLSSEILRSSLATWVILDRDYLSDAQVATIEQKLREIDIRAHVWMRKELESYLLSPSNIARCSGASEDYIRQELAKCANALKGKVFARYLDQRQQEQVGARRHRVDVTEVAQTEFDALWADVDRRLFLCPAKEIITALNTSLAQASHRTVSVRGLAVRVRRDEIPDEMAQLLLEIDQSAA
jgi:AAA domain, putative AbiEii toxin, Type IV TA system/AAA ATPase domain